MAAHLNFRLTPDLDVDQLGGDVGGSQLPHVEEGSGHVPAHHLYLPLPSLSGQIFSLFYRRTEPPKLVSQVLARILSFLMLYLFERNFFPAVSTNLKLTHLFSFLAGASNSLCSFRLCGNLQVAL